MADLTVEGVEYYTCPDPMQPNRWPVRVDAADGAEIGYLTEHITVNFDGNEPPVVRWSWTLPLGNLPTSGKLDVKPRFGSWRDALAVLARVHVSLTRSRVDES